MLAGWFVYVRGCVCVCPVCVYLLGVKVEGGLGWGVEDGFGRRRRRRSVQWYAAAIVDIEETNFKGNTSAVVSGKEEKRGVHTRLADNTTQPYIDM